MHWSGKLSNKVASFRVTLKEFLKKKKKIIAVLGFSVLSTETDNLSAHKGINYIYYICETVYILKLRMDSSRDRTEVFK